MLVFIHICQDVIPVVVLDLIAPPKLHARELNPTSHEQAFICHFFSNKKWHSKS